MVHPILPLPNPWWVVLYLIPFIFFGVALFIRWRRVTEAKAKWDTFWLACINAVIGLGVLTLATYGH